MGGLSLCSNVDLTLTEADIFEWTIIFLPVNNSENHVPAAGAGMICHSVSVNLRSPNYVHSALPIELSPGYFIYFL